MRSMLLLIAFLLSVILVAVALATVSPVSKPDIPSFAEQRPGIYALDPFENRAERPIDRMPDDGQPTNDSLYPISIAGVVQFPYVWNVVVQGNYAYGSSGSGLIILDVSNPFTPAVVSQLFVESGAQAHAVAVSGGIACLAPLRGNRFMTVDVSDPAHPQILGTCNPPGLPWGIKIHGNFAYASLYDSGLVAIDISSPSAPVTVGLVAGTEHTYEFEIAGDYIIAASHLDIKTVSIADPAHPTVVSTYSDLPTQTTCPGLAVQRNYVYVGADTAIYVLDMSNPVSPSLAGQSSGISGTMAIAGNYLYNALGMQGMTVFDISNPVHPVSVYQRYGDVWNVATSGSRLYVVGSAPSTFSVWDIISVPAVPSLLGNFIGPSSDLRDVAIVGNIAAVATNQLYLADISNPIAPELVGMVNSQVPGFWGVATDGQYIYAAGSDYALKVFDISDPANPAEVSSIYDEASRFLGISGKTAVSCGRGILCTFDISSPQNPVQRGRIDLGNIVMCGLKVRGDYAYIVANSNTGVLIIVNISDPANPTQAGIFQTAHGVFSTLSHAVEIEGNVAYLATGYGDLDVIDISNSTNPVRIGSGITYEPSSDLNKVGDYMFSADRSFSIFDTYISNHPVEISTRFFGGEGSHLISSGIYSYLLANGCLLILSAPEPTWMMGDADGSGAIDVSDAVRLVEYIFVQAEAPFPLRLGDANCDHAIDISDVVYLIGYVFGGGPAPCDK